MSKHTTGPWTVDPYGAEPAIRTNEGMAIVPRVFGTLADARLIAAAPDLYAAACRVLDGLNARLDAAARTGEPAPVFDGIAALHDAVNRARP